ncbi:MAG: GYD domain-containing protein [Thermodesulfobacteriota bacterium]
MATFFMFGKYNAKAVESISISRTEQAMVTVRELGGEVNGMYALLGEYDLLFCVELPDVEQAMKASVALTKLTGISFNSCPAVKVETFDRLTAE